MILRKPYAFFIKHFRLINFIMAALMAFLIYRTWTIGKFLNSYIADYITTRNNFIISDYINMYNFLLTLLIIIFTVIVLSVLMVKDKPRKLYIINLILYAIVMFLYGIDYYLLHGINEVIWDFRFSKAVRDITYIVLIMQITSFILTLIRATGFDIKQFNFSTDLQQLDVDTNDNEEFELAVEFDKNKMKRNVRRGLRNTKYYYVEHKFIINTSAIILSIIIVFLTVMRTTVYESNYKEGKNFQASGVVLNIKNTYIIQNEINKNNSLVVVKFDVRSVYTSDDKKLNTGLITLHANEKSYGQTPKYNTEIEDIGTPYKDQTLTNEFVSYVLVFDIPKQNLNEIEFKFNDQISYIKGEMGAKNIYVTLKPNDLTENKKITNKKITETLSFDGSILGNAELKIDSYEIANKFKLEYQFCSKKDHCYPSYEYLTPTATGNYFKTLMKINGEFEEDASVNIEDINDLFYFLNKYGEIHYKINDNWYEHQINSKLIKPQNGETDSYYIEVNKDIEKAVEIYFTFKVRNYSYQYTIK